MPNEGSRQVFEFPDAPIPEKIIVIFFAINAKPTPFDVYFFIILNFSPDLSEQPAFDSHWLDECANSTPAH